MNSISYHFKVGEFECVVVNDGTYTYSNPAPILFANASSDQREQALRKNNIDPDRWDEWISPLPCLVIQTGNHRVLVDTGLGDLDPNAGKLLQNLQSVGIQPDDIDTIILTHAHADHIGGNTDPDGRPAFPHARYFMRREEWDFWTSESTLAQPGNEWMGPFIQKQLLSLSNRFELLDQDTEIVLGVQALFAPGHTPGHMALAIVSGAEKLLCLSDVIAHPIHLEHTDWNIVHDYQPDLAVHTRRRFLELAGNEQARVFAFHLDFPGLGYVHPRQGAWQWQPITPIG